MTFEWVWAPQGWRWGVRWPRERLVHFTSGRPAARVRTGHLWLGPLHVGYVRRIELRAARS